MSTKRKLPQKLGQPVVKQSAKVLSKGNLDESKTVVSSGSNATKLKPNGTQESIEISSDEEEVEQEENSDAESDEEQESGAEADVAMEDADNTADGPIPDENDEDAAEPSFGDLVRANASEPIDVAGAFEDPLNGMTYPKTSQIQAPFGASLGTVLTQALKTNDISLLESCLHTTDVTTIRATIQRLESLLAGTLLQKLAERLHRRPGRAGTLMVWVQWTLVTHGGYLATQRDLMKKLAELNKVIDERAKGLQSLLSLKGKLDMLEAQIELRRSMQNQRRRADEDEDDEDVIYVEGQESEQEAGSGAVKPQRLAANGDLEDISDDDSEVSEDMPMTNGVIADSEDEEEESSDEDDLIDDAAEETDADTGDEDEVDHDDQDSEGEDDDSDDGVQAGRPAKMPKTGGMFSKKR
ncbi:NUC189-domain-containing protein [Mollisia scopiformis]|uniref:NUC189-domain-containing protein n=1 Tax=Mollisia scopiformis TaxID=149040 RepID=A0A194XEM0_MOLSC|nr:NUC189-domain-containing protein [Mollisia scopiformis]KUJ18202.1 NUC189-domain-containing protein [Mollisia scopiformis]